MAYPATGNADLLYLIGNAYYDGANWRYKTADTVSVLLLNDGASGLQYLDAPSGSAGAAATLTLRLQLSNGGGLTVTSPSTANVQTAIIQPPNSTTVPSLLVEGSSTMGGTYLGFQNNTTSTFLGGIGGGGTLTGMGVNDLAIWVPNNLQIGTGNGTVLNLTMNSLGVINLQPRSTTACVLTIQNNATGGVLDVGTGYFSTGAVVPALTGNKPGSLTTILGWMKVQLNGTVGWIPVWNN